MGFFLSATQLNPNDDTTSGLGETITSTRFSAAEKCWIGIKTNNYLLPTNAGTGFIGYTNADLRPGARGDSGLVASDTGTGTTPPLYFWRPKDSLSFVSGAIVDGTTSAGTFNDCYLHLPEDPANAGGYATLVMLRITRPNENSHALTVSIKQGTHSSDVLFTSDPSAGTLEVNLANYPPVVQTKIVNNMVNIPDALYLYWPFLNSRLRCHALGFSKAG